MCKKFTCSKMYLVKSHSENPHPRPIVRFRCISRLCFFFRYLAFSSPPSAVLFPALVMLLLLFFVTVLAREYDEAKLRERLARPWVNPYNFPQKVMFGKHCPHFECPEPLVCAYLKSSLITFETPMFCDFPESMCDLDAFNITRNVNFSIISPGDACPPKMPIKNAIFANFPSELPFFDHFSENFPYRMTFFDYFSKKLPFRWTFFDHFSENCPQKCTSTRKC